MTRDSRIVQEGECSSDLKYLTCVRDVVCAVGPRLDVHQLLVVFITAVLGAAVICIA